MSSIGASGVVVGPNRSEWVLPERQIGKILVEIFKEVPQVKSICARFSPNEIGIWTILENYDRNAREQVYERELKVCELLSLRDFDFRVTSLDLVSPSDLVRMGSVEIYKRD